MTENLSGEKLSEKINGKWSLKEHVGHLTDLEELHSGRLIDFREKKEILRAADMQNEKTYSANHNEKSISILLAEFEKARNNCVQSIINFSEEELNQISFHPRLKVKMRLVDMLFFVAEHDDHHLALMMRDGNLF